MSKHQLRPLTGREIKKSEKYILIRLHDAGHVVVNVMSVISEPVFSAAQGAKIFQAQGLHVGGRQLSEEDGCAIELSLNDIGCPWKGDLKESLCRTFKYGKIEHDLLAADVAANQSSWKEKFDMPNWVITYELPEYKPNSFMQDFGVGSTALSHWTLAQ